MSSTPVRLSVLRRPLIALLAIVLAATGCNDSPPLPPIPVVSFIVAAGDSTFWIESAPGGIRVRRSPMLLAEHTGRFFELYLADDDRSFYDAVIVAQRIFRRDLVTGDSVVLFEDALLAGIAERYAAAHPGERPLAPSEEASEEPATQATTDTELLEVVGPYLTYERHLDVDVAGERDQHETRRGVLDIRDGRPVLLEELVGGAAATAIYAGAREMLAQALDSARRAGGERARRALDALAGFTFDSSSFALLEDEGEPAVAFLVPGRGGPAGGYAFPLSPVRIAGGAWWNVVRSTLPSVYAADVTWTGENGAPDIIARDDSSGEWATLLLRAAPNEVAVTRVPAPVRRVYRLDPTADSALIRSLARAFDESTLYSGEARTAHRGPSPPLAPLILPVRRTITLP